MTKNYLRPLQIVLPTWLICLAFFPSLKPEFIALSAVTFAIVATTIDVRFQKFFKLGVVAICITSLVLITYDYLFHHDRIPLLHLLPLDLFLASISYLLVAMFFMYRHLGIGVSLIAILFVVYTLYGHHFGGGLAHGLIRPTHFVDMMFFTTDGILGTPLKVATGTVVHFLVFAAVLERTGGTRIFIEIAERAFNSQQGGAAKVSVISSALFGMVSGSPTSDVIATGSMTIPAMHASGYSRTKAAAIEVAASTGGSILPPIMGTAAFVLAEYTGYAYSDVLLAAFIPGIIYYAGLFLSVTLDARRLSYQPYERKSTGSFETRKILQLLLPITALIVFMLLGFPPSYSAGMGTVIALFVSSIRKEGALNFDDILKILEITGKRMIPVLAACLTAGLIIGTITMTGLSGKIAPLLLSITDGDLFPTLFVVSVVGIILGLGMPTTSAYILGAMFLAPALIDSGVPILTAHLFVLYFAILSAMTPPVAVAAFAAATILGGAPYKIGLHAIRFSIAAFLLPFLFIYFPGLLLQGNTLDIMGDILRSATSLGVIIIALEGILIDPLKLHERVFLGFAGMLILTPYWVAIFVAITLILVVITIQIYLNNDRD